MEQKNRISDWDYLKHINNRVLQEQRIWGWYKVLENVEYEKNVRNLVKHLFIEKGKGISYQRHFKRDEVWVIVYGSGTVIVNDMPKKVERGDVIFVKAGEKHLLYAYSDLHFIEVQIGTELIEEDIERIKENEWEKNREL